MRLPLGYRDAATYAGIRKEHKEDLGLIFSNTPASAAAVFTQNRLQAAPVRVSSLKVRFSITAMITPGGVRGSCRMARP